MFYSAYLDVTCDLEQMRSISVEVLNRVALHLTAWAFVI